MIPQIDLPGGGRTTALGFGCSTLFGGAQEAASCGLIEAALTAGIRHFDVAPSYAWGQAESVLGRALAGMDGEVTVATKVGIGRPAARSIFTRLRDSARPLKRWAPGLWSAVGGRTRQASRPVGQFDLEFVRAELETSRRNLGRERLDLYLMHEMRLEAPTQALVEFLEAERTAGRIGALGLGTSYSDVVDIAAAWPALATIGQVRAQGFARPVTTPPTLWVTHGAIAGGLRRLTAWRNAEKARAARLSVMLDLDWDDTDAVAGALLAGALVANEGGIVLVSTTRAERIGTLVANAMTPEAVARGRRLLTELNRVEKENFFGEYNNQGVYSSLGKEAGPT